MLIHRPRRLRLNETLRAMLCETRLNSSDFVLPLFIKEGIKEKKAISSMPGHYQLTLKDALKECGEIYKLGLKSIILFGIPKHKDQKASEAYNDQGYLQDTIKAIKDKYPKLYIITDVCLCEYMEHGHCGIVDKKGEILNDPSLELLAKTAASHAGAGADMVAPSDMMDGRVWAIRKALDQTGFLNTPIMSYAVKYASSFYGPFREAAESTPQFGDRKTYQMDYANKSEALREALLDIEEGADMIMVKPALAYLDIIAKLKSQLNTPLAAYQVSGEYSQIMAAAAKGWISEEGVMLESLTAIKRAGAQLIITYFAKKAVQSLSNG
ncbi:MAG: hypothetical protein ACD_73C00720G0002 [uncultured bacterium]|nr:MAG: hypothetical protein ACD_73C00720G0002 [uncultured bacterium]